MIDKKFTVISTFAGCGGSSLGYKMAGYNELLAIDFKKYPCDMLKTNFQDLTVWQKDIKTVTAKQILDETGLKIGELDILDGSPPCPSYSKSNTRKYLKDPRNFLIYEQIRLIEGLKPKVFVIENVPEMVGEKTNPYWEDNQRKLFSLGYSVKIRIMNSMYYGVPQNRNRAIIIGVRKDLGMKPSFPEWDRGKIKTFTETTGYDGFISIIFQPKIFSGCKPVCTITRTRNINFIHNDEEFKPPIDDIKALCSFPKSFILTGAYTNQFAVMGNSVMPLMMKAIAENIRVNILEPYYSLLDKNNSDRKAI